MSEFVALHRGPPPMPVRTAHRQLNQQQPMNIIETGIESGTMRLRTIGCSKPPRLRLRQARNDISGRSQEPWNVWTLESKRSHGVSI